LISYVTSGLRSPTGSFESAARWITASKPSSSRAEMSRMSQVSSVAAVGASPNPHAPKKPVSIPTTSWPASVSIGVRTVPM
jgi:hypothetical protein